MEALTCKCCGAPINRDTYKCDYCGTQYKRPTEKLPTLIIERPGVKVLSSEFKVDDYEIRRLGADYLYNEIKWHSIQQMMETLIPLMEVSTMFCPEDFTTRIRTRLRVVEPGRTI